MNHTEFGGLDHSQLECVRHTGNKIVARCPACAENGGDNHGEHLVIFKTGQFGCVAFTDDRRHRRRIFELAGITGKHLLDREQARGWQQKRVNEQREEEKRQRLVNVARAKRTNIINGHLWNSEEIVASSPQRINCLQIAHDPRHFLKSLFHEDALVWAGAPYQSGHERFACHWRTCREWCCASIGERIGPMVAPGIWKPDTISRSAPNVLATPYVVLDFDGLDGVHPETQEQLDAHIRASFALTRWLSEKLHWRLAAILWTGGKSLHTWFHTPPQYVLDSLETTAVALGLDAGLLGHPEHPCRLPGQRHQNTGDISRVVWLQEVSDIGMGDDKAVISAPALPRLPPIPGCV